MIDVVYIGTIHTNHAELSKMMLNAGKAVLCEKPMAMNLRQASSVIELAKAKNVFFMEVSVFSKPSFQSLFNYLIIPPLLSFFVLKVINFGRKLFFLPWHTFIIRTVYYRLFGQTFSQPFSS